MSQHLLDSTHELPAPFLTEHGYVFEEEETRRQLVNQSGELEHQAVAVVAPVSTTLLLRETLAGRTAGKDVKFGRSDAGHDGFPRQVLSSDSLDGAAYASPVAFYGSGIGIEGIADPETCPLQSETQPTGATEAIHRDQAHPNTSPK